MQLAEWLQEHHRGKAINKMQLAERIEEHHHEATRINTVRQQATERGISSA